MKAAICLNGEPPAAGRLGYLEGAFVAACDGAMNWLEEAGIRPDLLLGDFDSLLPETRREAGEILSYPAHKDYTDGELALNVLLERGFDEFVILGGGGKRDDHFYFNLYLLYRVFREGKKGVFVTNYCEIYLFDRDFSLPSVPGQTVSMAPYFESVHIIRTDGLEYPLRERTLHAGESLGVSNVALGERFSVRVSGGLLILFLSNPIER